MSDEKMDYINDINDIDDDTKMNNIEHIISKKGYINTYNTISTYLYNEGVKGIRNIFITEFLRFINEEPSLAIPMLLWIDTFHDFKRTRGKKTKDESLYLITSINNVLDFYIRNKKDNKNILIGNWVEEDFDTSLYDKQSKIKNPLIYSENKHYSISKCFRDSFFDYKQYNNYEIEKQTNKKAVYNYIRNDDYTIMAFYPFHEDVKNTVLKPCYEWDQKNNKNYEDKPILQHKCARILYQLSLVVYDTEQPFEPQLLYTYILYNFLKSDKGNYIRGHHISKGLEKSVFTYIPSDVVKYYAKDVDTKKTTSVLEDAKLIILPASLFDKNKANSSDIPGNFANIPKTIIPYDFYNKSFIYNYVNIENDKDNRCTLTVKTPWDNDNNTNLEFTSKCNNQSISSFTTEFKTKIMNLSNNFDDNTNLKIRIDIIPDIEDMIKNADKLKLAGNVVKDGFSVEEISIRLLFEIINNIKNNNVTYKYNLLSPSCFDKYMSLKRVGDFGQILQCKQLGIPLITDDNMQILLSIACCSSVIWTPSDKLLYYNGESDCFYHFKNNICSIQRKNKEYKNEIDTNVLNQIGKIDNKDNVLYKVTDFEEKYSIYTGSIYIQPSFEEIVEETLKKEKEKEVQKTVKKNKQQEDLQNKSIEDENKELERKNILLDFILSTPNYKTKNFTNTDASKTEAKLFTEGMSATSDTELNKLKKELSNNESTVLNLSNIFNSINSEEDTQISENKKRERDNDTGINTRSSSKKPKQKIVISGTLKGRRKYKNRSGPGKKYKRYTNAKKSKSRKNK